jgi:hypothetical protein
LLYRHSRSLSTAAFEGFLSFLVLFFALVLAHSDWPVLGFLGEGPVITLPFWLLALSTAAMLMLWLLLLGRMWQQNWGVVRRPLSAFGSERPELAS